MKRLNLFLALLLMLPVVMAEPRYLLQLIGTYSPAPNTGKLPAPWPKLNNSGGEIIYSGYGGYIYQNQKGTSIPLDTGGITAVPYGLNRCDDLLRYSRWHPAYWYSSAMYGSGTALDLLFGHYRASNTGYFQHPIAAA